MGRTASATFSSARWPAPTERYERKKRPPERPSPRGAKDSNSSGSDWNRCDRRRCKLPLPRSPIQRYTKRTASIHVGGIALHGPQEPKPEGRSQVQTHPRGSVVSLFSARTKAGLIASHKAARIEDFSFCVKSGSAIITFYLQPTLQQGVATGEAVSRQLSGS